MNLTSLPDPSPLVALQTLNLVGNLQLLGRGRLPDTVWAMTSLKELCIAPIGPLNCTETVELGRAGYELAVIGAAPDPDSPPPGSFCINADCPVHNAHQQLLPKMPRGHGGNG